MARWPTRRRCCRCPTMSRSRMRAAFQLIGKPAKRIDTPDKVNGKAQYRHRRQDSRHEDRDGGGLPGIRRQARAPRRQQGQGRQGRAPGGAARTMRWRWSPITWGRPERASRRSTSPGRPAPTPNSPCGPDRAARGSGEAARRGRRAGWRCRQGHGWRRQHARGALPAAITGARHLGADELHGSRAPTAATFWVGTQVITRAQATAAEVTGLPLEKVRVHNHLLGGGFRRDGWRSTVSPRRCRSPGRSKAP